MTTPTPYPWMEDSQYVTTPVVTGYLAVTSPNGLYLTNGSSTTTITPTAVTSTTFNGALNGNASTAAIATNIAGGAGGQIPYQSGTNATSFTATGTSGQVLTSQGTSAPTWATPTGLPANPGTTERSYLLFNNGSSNAWDDVRNTSWDNISLFSTFPIIIGSTLRWRNLAVGPGTLSNMTGNGINNTAVGVNALTGTATSYSNVTAVGFNAGGSSTFSSTQANNVFVGNGAGAFSAGTNNVYIGGRQVAQSASGSNNVCIGGPSGGGGGPGTGGQNTFIGSESGANSGVNATGSNNTFIGYQAGQALVAGATTTANNVVLGNNAVTFLRCNTQVITSLSDARDKKNFEELDAGIDFVNELKPIRFEWNRRDGSMEGRKEVGFTAQSLQETQATTGIKIPNLLDDSDPETLCIAQGVLIPVLVKALQELSAEVKMLKEQINALSV